MEDEKGGMEKRRLRGCHPTVGEGRGASRRCFCWDLLPLVKRLQEGRIGQRQDERGAMPGVES